MHKNIIATVFIDLFLQKNPRFYLSSTQKSGKRKCFSGGTINQAT